MDYAVFPSVSNMQILETKVFVVREPEQALKHANGKGMSIVETCYSRNVDTQIAINWIVVDHLSWQYILDPTLDRSSLWQLIVKLCLQHNSVARVNYLQLILVYSRATIFLDCLVCSRRHQTTQCPSVRPSSSCGWWVCCWSRARAAG